MGMNSVGRDADAFNNYLLARFSPQDGRPGVNDTQGDPDGQQAGGPNQAAGPNGAGQKDGNPQESLEYVAPPGHGSGCGHCTAQARWVPKEQVQQAKEQRNKEIYNEVMAHEQAHASVKGGSISITQDSETGAASGVTMVPTKGLNPENPDDTITDAELTIKAAMAPKDPSGQDYRVKAEAEGLISQARSIKQTKEAEEGQNENGSGRPQNGNQRGQNPNQNPFQTAQGNGQNGSVPNSLPAGFRSPVIA